MSTFRHARLSLSRLFTLLACVTLPDGEGVFSELFRAQAVLKQRIEEHKRKEGYD